MSHYVTQEMVRALFGSTLSDIDCFLVGREAWQLLCEDIERNDAFKARYPHVQPGELKNWPSTYFMDVPENLEVMTQSQHMALHHEDIQAGRKS